MALRDVIPPPPIEKLKELQLKRYSLVKFVDLKNFEEAIQGCYVRVLLEMRTERESSAPNNGDSYYIAAVKGAQRGPSYSGFSWDGLTTEWHIIIDLPPCFRSGPNNNIVQFNSISNSDFSQTEYRDWVQMARESGRGFPTTAQLDLRIGLLRDLLVESNIDVSQGPVGKARRRPADADDPEKQREREAQWVKLKQVALEEIKSKYVLLPTPDKLDSKRPDELAQIQRDALDLAGRLRRAISDRNRCRACLRAPNTVVCYPCKHQSLCAGCAKTASVCPICAAVVAEKFEPYTG